MGFFDAISRLFIKPPAPAAPPIAHDALVDLLLRLNWVDPEKWAAALAAPMAAAQINTPKRIAAFLANVGHETAGGRRLVESLDYTPAALGQFFGKRATPAALASCRRDGRKADQRAIANAIYGGDWGRKNLGNELPCDGWAFIGRGLLQITGRANYEATAKALGMSIEAMSRAMETKDGAAKTACQWWAWAKCNDLADQGLIASLRKRVNGGSIGLIEVQNNYARALEVIGE